MVTCHIKENIHTAAITEQKEGSSVRVTRQVLGSALAHFLQEGPFAVHFL